MSAEPPLKIESSLPKIAPAFQDSINVASPAKIFKIWVFFTDKEIFDKPAYKKALTDMEGRFTAKAIARRRNRSENKEFDFYDIPVSSNYIRRLDRERVQDRQSVTMAECGFRIRQ